MNITKHDHFINSMLQGKPINGRLEVKCLPLTGRVWSVYYNVQNETMKSRSSELNQIQPPYGFDNPHMKCISQNKVV